MFNQDNKIKDLQAQINRLNEEAADLIRDPQWNKEFAQQSNDEIWYGFNHTNFTEVFTDVERKGLADLATIDTEVRGLTAFHIARGGYIEESSIHSETAYIPKDQIGIHVVEQIDRLETGFVPAAQKIVRQAPVRLDAEINRRVIKTMQAAIPSSSAYYTATSNLTLSQIEAAISGVKDVIEPDAGEPVIIARAGMIQKIRSALTVANTFNMFLPVTNEDLLRRGVVTSFMGTPIVELPNYTDEFGRSYFPGNELWVVGKSIGKTVFYGTPRTNTWIENEGEYWHWQQRLNYGVSIYRPSHARRIVDSSVSA